MIILNSMAKENIVKKIKNGAKMTLDTLAMITKKGFDELRDEMSEMKDELRGEMGEMKDELRGEMGEMKDELRDEIGEMKDYVDKKFDEVLTGEDRIMGELQVMREEHAASFGIYKNIEERVFGLEQTVKTIQKRIGLETR